MPLRQRLRSHCASIGYLMRAQYCRCCGWPARGTRGAIATAALFHSNPRPLGLAEYLRCERGFKEATIYTYRRHLSEFAEYLSRAGVTSFSELSLPLSGCFLWRVAATPNHTTGPSRLVCTASSRLPEHDGGQAWEPSEHAKSTARRTTYLLPVSCTPESGDTG
jgi:hypothetical protein